MSDITKNPVLIAGGAGFIGSNLVAWHLARGRHVHCIDNLSTGTRQANAAHSSNSRFKFFEADITDSQFISQLENQAYSEIYNLACPTGVPNIKRMGEAMLLTSAQGSLNLLRLAQAAGARYLFASTAEVYGDPQVFPQAETYGGNVDPVGARSAYEEGKRFGEAITAYYAHRHSVDTRIVRIFNTYGENMSLADSRVIPNMLSSMAGNRRVIIFGDGESTRTFLYVTDLIDGFACVMAQKRCGEVFNIGGEREMTINQLFDACRRITGSTSKPEYQPHFIEDHRRRLPDTSKVRALGWEPKVSIEQGLSLSYHDVKNRLSMASRDTGRNVPPAAANNAVTA